jgi:NADPH:quinone reductase-like Zn-dependent oxidoreductase
MFKYIYKIKRGNFMKAIMVEKYGPPEVLSLRETEKPVVKDKEVLIRIAATVAAPPDCAFRKGQPFVSRLFSGLAKPKHVPGDVLSGEIKEAGLNVSLFKKGDRVYGSSGTNFGTNAEYISLSEEEALAVKPDNISHAEAACISEGALTALPFLRDAGQIKAGQKVLINGASGGVGTFALQIAKAFDTEVTAVVSTRNVEIARTMGADHVIDYTKEDFTKREERYDLVFDNVNNHSFSERRRLLNPGGICVLAGIGSAGLHKGQLGRIAGTFAASFRSRFIDQKFERYITRNDQADLKFLSDLMAEGKVTPFVEKTYPFAETAEALRYFEQGHARGKLVIKIVAVVTRAGELTWAETVHSVGRTREVNH